MGIWVIFGILGSIQVNSGHRKSYDLRQFSGHSLHFTVKKALHSRQHRETFAEPPVQTGSRMETLMACQMECQMR